MPNWNDIFDETTDWTAVEFLGMFWDAYIERIEALTGNRRGGTHNATTGIPEFFTGVCVDSSEQELPGTMHGNPLAVVAGIYPAKVADSVEYSGEYPFDYVFAIRILQNLARTLQPQRFAACQHTVWQWAKDEDEEAWPEPWTWSELAAAAGLNSAGFTRKYPREIGVGVAADGDKARAVSTGGGLKAGEVYKRVAGAWVMVDPAVEDARPDTLTAYGYIEPGDYIGPWIWNEIRDVYNHLRWTVDTQTFLYGGYSWQTSTHWKQGCKRRYMTQGGDTYEEAQDDLMAGYESQAETDDSTNFWDCGAMVSGARSADEDGVEVYGYAAGERFRCTVGTLISTHAPSEVTLFILTEAPPVAAPMTYDSFGDADIPVAAGSAAVETWAKSQGSAETITRALGSTAASFTWPDLSLIPGQTDSAYRGYWVTDVRWLVRWDVAGGLEYTAAT